MPQITLDVPFAEKDEAKALGARWDAQARSWYIDASRDPAPFSRWLPPTIAAGPTVQARVLALSERCYRCNASIMSIIGVIVASEFALDPSGFVEFEDVGEALAALLPEDLLAKHGIGPLRRRSSSVRPEPYWSNGCLHCGAIQGGFFLREALNDALVEGLGYEELPTIDVVALPIAAIKDQT
jgi:hypothetical protein